MAQESKPSTQNNGPTPQQLDRLTSALRAAEVARKAADLVVPRPAETYGKIRDERANTGHICSSPQ